MTRLLFILLFSFGLVFADIKLDNIPVQPATFKWSDFSLDYIALTGGLSPESLNIFDLSYHFKYKKNNLFSSLLELWFIILQMIYFQCL